MLTRFGAIQKIWVCCYNVIIFDNGWDVHSEEVKELIIIGIDKESIKDSKYSSKSEMEGFTRTKKYKLKTSKEISKHELTKRFDLSESQIKEILGGKNLELSYYDLEGTDYFYECKLSIEEIIEKRRIDTEPFDVEEIVNKISSEYVLTPKRKKDLLAYIKKLL